MPHPLTFRQRLAVATKSLVGLFSDRATEEAYGMLAQILPGGRGEPPKKGTAEFLRAYSESPWYRAVIEKIARGEAAVTWRLYGRRGPRGKAVKDVVWQRGQRSVRDARLKSLAGERNLIEVVEHPLLEALYTGNTYFTGLQTRKLWSIYEEAVGEAFLLKERNLLGVPSAFWPIPAHWVTATPTPSDRSYTVSFRGWQARIPDTEMLWTVNPDPLNPYGRGTSIARALADDLDADELAAKHVRNWFANSARPDLLVFGEGMTPADTRLLEERWLARLRGVFNPGQPFFLNRKVEVQEVGQDFAQMQLTELRAHARDMVVHGWGLPPEILGIIENSNRATIDAADYLFARNILVPRLEDRRAFLQEKVIPEYDDRLVLEYESPVAEDQEFALKVAQAAPWAIDVDTWRAKMGEPELPDGQGKVFMVPFQLLATRSPGEAAGPGAAWADPSQTTPAAGAEPAA
jgi:hypothetical protein